MSNLGLQMLNYHLLCFQHRISLSGDDNTQALVLSQTHLNCYTYHKNKQGGSIKFLLIIGMILLNTKNQLIILCTLLPKTRATRAH